MARVVRKVSNKAVKGQKKERKGLLFSKKFWIIIISIVVVLAAAGITIGVIVANNQKSKSTVEVDDYFGQTQKYKETEVNFEKITYQGVKLHTNSDSELYDDYVFVFATDLNSFYPFDLYADSKKKDNMKVDRHSQIFDSLVNLQYVIDEFNKTSDTSVRLFIVDTSTISGNSSNLIYTDTDYVPDATSDSEFVGPLFFAYYDGKLQKTYDVEKIVNGNIVKESRNLYAKSYYDDAENNNSMMTAISNSIKKVQTLEK